MPYKLNCHSQATFNLAVFFSGLLQCVFCVASQRENETMTSERMSETRMGRNRVDANHRGKTPVKLDETRWSTFGFQD